MKKLRFFLIILILAVNHSIAQNSDWLVFNTNNSDIPHNTVRSLTVESNGIKWIGTDGGLAKFDDSNWTIYNTSNSALPHNTVLAITIDSNNNKWIGTHGGGLAKFDDSNWTIYNTSNSVLPNDRIYSIFIDLNGEMWIGTNGGLAKFDGTNWTVYNYSNTGMYLNSVRTIVKYGNSMWFGTGDNNGLVKFDGNNWLVYHSSNSDLPGPSAYSLAFYPFSILWVATNGGLAKFDGTNWTVYNTSNSGVPSNTVYRISLDALGDKWVGTNGGIAKFDGTNWTVYNTSNSDLPHNTVLSITIDKIGNIWIGTNGGGLAVLLANKDVGVESFVSITDTVCGSEEFEIEIKLKNHGKMWISDFDVTAIISGSVSDTIHAFFEDTIDIGKSKNFKLGTINTGTGGNIEIMVYASLLGDVDRQNDTLRIQIYVHPYPAAPIVADDTVCQGEVAILTGSNTDHLTRWYLSPTTQNAIHTGASYTTFKINSSFSFYVSNFTELGCPGLREQVRVTALTKPTAPAIVQGTLFEGNWNAGTLQEPDEICAGNTLAYEFPPPNGFTNSDFGNQWDISVSLMTADGFSASGLTLKMPDVNSDASLTYTAPASDNDSLFVLYAIYTLNSTECTDTVSRYVSVKPTPEASFAVNNQCENSETTFNNTSGIISGNLISYEWNFGDGNTSAFLGPTHTYLSSGKYMVSLKVTSDALCVDETTKEIDIFEMPQADFEVGLACALDSFQFKNLTTFSEGSGILNYEWDFGIDQQTSNGFEPDFIYVDPGTFFVSLKATSPDGCVSSIGRNIEVYDSPYAEFETEDACTGSMLFLSNKSEGESLSSHWLFGDGKSSTEHEPEYAYEAPGTYEIQLNVTDLNGCKDNFTTQIQIFALPDAGFIHTESMGKVNFKPDHETYVSYEWDFGDGNSSTESAPEHEYTENGNFEVRLKVVDLNGCVNEEVKNITISSVSTEIIADKRSLNFKVYPNPFHNEAILSYELNKNTEVSIVLYDINGKEPAIIERGYKQPGTHTTILNTINSGLAAGVYIIQLQVGNEVVVERVVVLE